MVWSPRERGWTLRADGQWDAQAVVPARAGVDRRENPGPSAPRCGPRASGGGPANLRKIQNNAVWSPRERGWTPATEQRDEEQGVVPARAGVDPDRRRSGRWRARGPRASGGGP